MTKTLLHFFLKFCLIFGCCYGFNLGFIALTHRQGLYIGSLETVNYIEAWRQLLLKTTAAILHVLGRHSIIHASTLHVEGKRAITLSYSCIGYGVCSFYISFILAWPCYFLRKVRLLLPGLLLLQLLNILRLVVLSLAQHFPCGLDPHLVYNLFTYALLVVVLYKWTGEPGEGEPTG